MQLWYKFIFLLSILLIDLLDMHLSAIDNDTIIFQYVHFWWRTHVCWFWYLIINETIFHILVKLRINQISSDIFVEVLTCWNNSIENERSFDFIITLYDNWNFLLDSVWLLWIFFCSGILSLFLDIDQFRSTCWLFSTEQQWWFTKRLSRYQNPHHWNIRSYSCMEFNCRRGKRSKIFEKKNPIYLQ